MRINISLPNVISLIRRRLPASSALFILSMFAFAQAGLAQNQLTLADNYFVTGDYVVGGVGLRGLGVNGLATGQINIPDVNSVPATGVPAGADIVAAFLYWETVASNQPGAQTGQLGFFNGYPITGTVRGNPNAPTSWSTGGCSGSSQGSKTMVVYRADVRPYLNVDSDGIPAGNGTYTVSLPDSGSNGGGVPLTLGASLVIVYRVHSLQVPLNSVVIYDGAYAPSNAGSTMTLPISGFYQAGAAPNSAAPAVKITHIVGNGQPNKLESVQLNSLPLDSLYSANGLPPFPGIYNQNLISTTTGGGSWDNPTWQANAAIAAGSTLPATSIVTPSGSNSGCVNWGAVVFSTTVQNGDNDGILDVWKLNHGYTQVNPNGPDFGDWVALPGATSGQKDLFVEVDYLSNLDAPLAGAYKHSHLPKQKALDQVGQAFLNQGIHVHFDLGPGIYPGDQFVVPYPVVTPAGQTAYPGAGGKALSESLLLCNDGAVLCAYPGQVTVGWKGGVEFVENQSTLGNFQFGRKDSYHYLLMGHTLGSPRTYWTATGMAPNVVGTGLATLVSIKVSGGVGTVNLSSPAYVTRPGDAACTDVSCDRVSIEGALLPSNTPLNGSFKIQTASSSTPDNTVPSTSTVTILMPGVPNGTYDYTTEPQLGLTFGGPTSDSGFSDIGGGDSTVTFGSWRADDPVGCQPNPSTAVIYCTDQVGTTTAQAGTILHELGHTFFFTHGGTYFPNPNPQYLQSFGLNCNPAYESSMNYLFQIRGFPDGGIDYSGQTLQAPQTLQALDETSLNEMTGLGVDLFTGKAAAHFTRWYAPPNALDMQLQNSVGGIFAGFHCDGSPNIPKVNMVRVDGTLFPGATASAAIDWNHDFIFQGTNLTAQDINFSGTSDSSLPGFNDWTALDLRQIGARTDAFGFSDGSGGNRVGGGGNRVGGGGNRVGGGGNRVGGGGNRVGGGGSEQDTDTANSTADAVSSLSAALSGHSVLLNWAAPEFGQIRTYSVWRAVGSFKTVASIYASRAQFTSIATVTGGTPPKPTYLDGTVKNNTTYTYFIVDMNKQGAQSTASIPTTITVKF